MKNSTKSKVIPIIVFFALYSIASINLFKSIEETQFYGDESGWISSANYYTDLLHSKGDCQWQKWECKECGPWGSLNPHLGQWIIGLFLKVFVPQQEQVFFKLYDFNLSLDKNKELGLVPPQQILLISRSISAVFGVLCGLLIFSIGYFSNNIWVGGIAAIQ